MSRHLTTLFLPLVLAAAACEDDKINGAGPGNDNNINMPPETPEKKGNLELSTRTLDFGDVIVNRTESRTLTAKNNGDAALNIETIRIEPAGDFATEAATRVLEPGEELAIEVTFTPAGEGLKAAALFVNDALVSLNGNGASAACDASGEQRIASGNNALGAAALAYGGGDELGIAWMDGTERPGSIGYAFLFKKIALDGAERSLPLTIGPGGVAHRPRITFGRDSYALTWSDVRHQNNEVYFQTISTNGAPAAEVRLTDNPAVSFPATGAYSPQSGEYLIVFSEGDGQVRELFARRLGADGAAIGADIQLTNSGGTAEYASVLWAGDRWVISWYEHREGVLRVFATVLSPAGIQRPEVELSDGRSFAWMADAAWNGSEVGVVWGDEREGYPAIYFARLSPDGTLIGMPQRISSIGTRASFPSIVWDRGAWLVAWASGAQNMERISGVRVAADGTAGAEATFVCGAAGARGVDPELVAIDGGVGMAWTDYRSGASEIWYKTLR